MKIEPFGWVNKIERSFCLVPQKKLFDDEFLPNQEPVYSEAQLAAATKEHGLEVADLCANEAVKLIDEAVAEERERCVKVCEELYGDPRWPAAYRTAAKNCATAIRKVKE